MKRVHKIILVILITIVILYLINLYISSSVNPELNYKYKHEYLDPKRTLLYYFINRDKVSRKELKTANIRIMKPNYCDGFAHGVSIVKNSREARNI